MAQARTGGINESWLVAGCLALGAFLALPLVVKNPNLGSDSLRCLLPIHNWMAGLGYSLGGQPHITYPPGFGALAYGVFLLCRDIPLSGMIVALLSYLLLIPSLYVSARRVYGPRAGVLAAFLATLAPFYLRYSYVNFTDLPFSLFLLWDFELCLRAQENPPRAWRGLVLGAVLGYAFLIRPEGFQVSVLAIGLLGLLALAAWRGWGWSWVPPAWPRGAKAFLVPLMAALAFIACVGPYMSFLHRHTGHWSISSKFRQTLIVYGQGVTEGFDPQAMERREASPWLDESKPFSMYDYVRQQGWGFARRMALNLASEVKYLGQILYHGLVPLLLLVAWALARGRLLPQGGLGYPGGPALRVLLTTLVFISPLAGLLIFYISDRFLLPYSLFLLMPLAGLGAWLSLRLWPSRPGLGLAGLALAGLLCLAWAPATPLGGLKGLLLPPMSMAQVLGQEHANAGMRAAGLWLHQHHQGGDFKVAGAKKLELMLFYAHGQDPEADMAGLTLDYSSRLEQAAALLTSGQADYLVLDDHYAATYPGLGRLWRDPALAPSLGLSLLRQDPKGRFQIYGRASR